jgi:hypothetical protein
MPQEGFEPSNLRTLEPTNPEFEQADLFQASDHAATAIGLKIILEHKIQLFVKINKIY